MFEFRNGSLHAEPVPPEAIAREFGTPCYVYSRAAIAGEMGRHAPVSFRVNPDVDARTHRYISTGLKKDKFGVEFDAAPEL